MVVISISLCVLTLVELRLLAQNTLQMEFVKIPAGEFMMGCSTGDSACNPDESPRHQVRITKSFDLGKFEVTQAQWVAVTQSNPSSNKGDSHPVESVSKLEIEDFISKLNARNDGYRYRLPTEAEWEYAARAGTDAATSGALKETAWYAVNSDDETHAVGQKKPNAWGLYDTLGNVREFVSDFYSGDYYAVSPDADPKGPQLILDGRGFGGVGRGGRGGPLQPPASPPPGPDLRGRSQQEQIDALREQVEELQRELQQLRNQFEAGPRGGPFGPFGPGRGPQQGPVTRGPDGQFIDPLDGLPTGLPVVRGGGWDQPSEFQRVSGRYSYYGPTLRLGDIGFRLVREPATR
jgi:formylglycine-generating enzyme required for sulfatase activity